MKSIFTKTFCFLLFTNQLIAQQIYYVSPNGDDNSTHPENINTPWKTFSKACSTAIAGSKVYFRGGVYNEKYINFINSGTSNQYIEFINYPNETPIFQGGNMAAYFILINGQSYIKITGIQFRQLIGNVIGIKVTGVSHHIEFKKCKISELFFSNNANDVPISTQNVNPLVFCGSDNITAINNIIVDSCEVSNCRTGYSEAITLVGNVSNFVVSNNYINNTGNIGIVAAGYYNWCNSSASNSQARNGIIRGNLVENCRSLAAIAAGIYVDGGKNIIIEQNTVRNGQRGFQINCENHHNIAGASADKIIIRSNLAYNNSRGGIGLGTQSTGNVTNSWIINNTCVNNFKSQTEPGDGGVYQDFGELNLDHSSDCFIRNNIFYSSISGRNKLMNSYPSSPITNLSTDYNVWFDTFNYMPYFVFASTAYVGLNALKTAINKELNSKFENPNFVNVATADFRLSSESSPAYDFSDANSVSIDSAGTQDLAKKIRMKNKLHDAGAYEFQCPSSDISINYPLTYKTYFFETNGKIFINSVINSNKKVTLKSPKAVLFQTGFFNPQSTTLQTNSTGCNNL